MKERILLISYILLLAIWGQSQATFVKVVGGSGNDRISTTIPTNDGNFLVIGDTEIFGSGNLDCYVAKVNKAAKTIWDKSIDGGDDETYVDGIQMSSGQFALVGWTESNGAGGRDILITVLNNFGNILWSKTFGTVGFDMGFKVFETSDGNIIVLGSSKFDSDTNGELIVLKLSMNGDDLWQKYIETDLVNSSPSLSIAEYSPDIYTISGGVNNTNTPSSISAAFYSIDANGGVIDLSAYDLASNQDLIFRGESHLFTDGFQYFGNTLNQDFFEAILMTTFDSEREFVWSKKLSVADRELSVENVVQKDDGNYLLAGTCYDFESPHILSSKGIIIEITEDGVVEWAKSYGSGYEELKSVIKIEDGIISFGKSLLTYNPNLSEHFIVKTNEFGSISGCSEEVNIIVEDVVLNEFTLSPVAGNFSAGEFQTFNTSSVDFEEQVVCDGCSSDDLVAGLFCETAPIICSIDCLDGFTATLPDELIMPQPDPLCDGGIPNNVSWFAFVAGSNTIDLSIIPTNCTTIFDDTGMNPQTIGIQAGVYADCDFEDSFICETDGCLDLVAETINISSNQFEIGKTYYLFVDGCGGSVCDYEVVVNSAEQAFEMPEITTISNDLDINLDEDTLCKGTQITFTLDSFDLSVNYNWSIDPPTPLYPSGVHPVIDTNAVTFHFSEEGCFDIHVYAFNDCDNSETRSFSVCVEALEDEVFSEISVCQECFPITLVAPESGCIITEGGGTPTVLTEDPNGDGVPGWFGTSTIAGPGLDSNLVTNAFGCTYMQYVNVVEIPLSPREQIEYYYCLTDFPVNINGVMFNNPGDSRNITLEGQAVSGCDSLINITAHGIDLFGSSAIGNCESGEVELAFEISTVIPEDYDSIMYEWFDENGMPISDTDGIDSILVVTGVGSYSVQVTVTAENVSCAQTYGPFMVDVDNLAPDTPTITYTPNQICASANIAQIYVGNQGLGENYDWTINPDLPYSFGLTTDTIFVEIGSGEDFQFCVQAMNGCGMSSEICDDVIVNQSPDSEFSFTSDICIDSFVLIEYTGANGALSSSVFNWDFDGGSILNGMNPNSAGPFHIGFSTSGAYTIGLMLEEAGCSSILTEHEVNVVDPFQAPLIDCTSESGVVTFSWDDTGVESVDVTIITAQSMFTLDGNTLIIDGLSSEEEVEVQFLFNGGDVCGGAMVTDNCTSQPCPSVSLEVSLSDQNICLSEDTGNILLDVTITGDNSGSGSWFSPHLIGDSEFDINASGIGEFPISYMYQINDCSYTFDTSVFIYDIPSLDFLITPSFCEEMGDNTIDILTESANSVLLDGNEISVLSELNIDPGAHELMVINPDGCSTNVLFDVENQGVETIQILGETSIIEGESGTYNADINSTFEDFVTIWTLDGDTICVDCNEVNVTPETDGTLCLSLMYGEGCELEECVELQVNERTKLFIPNIFSPNDDNINDVFKINSNNSDAFIVQMMIFDRWGELVFNKTGSNVGEEEMFWNGRFKGAPCVPGVYVYIIDYLDEEGRPRRISGDLTLVR